VVSKVTPRDRRLSRETVKKMGKNPGWQDMGSQEWVPLKEGTKAPKGGT